MSIEVKLDDSKTLKMYFVYDVCLVLLENKVSRKDW
jgi:hypothetical protein